MLDFPPSEKSLHQIFIALLITEIAFFVLTVPLSFFGGMMAEAAIEEAVGPTEMTGPEVAVTVLASMIALVGIPSLIASWVGLFLYKSWARWLYAATGLVLGIIYVPISFMDFTLTWGLPSALNDLASVVSGAILATIFLTPLAHRFAPETKSTLVDNSIPRQNGG